MVDALLIGSTKSATSTLYHVFKGHKGVALPRGDETIAKEPHYFSQGLFGPNYNGLSREIKKSSEYNSLWREAPLSALRCDFDPHTMHGPQAIELLFEANPQAKVFAILRNLIERAYSHYLMDVRECVETRPFLEAVREEHKEYIAGSVEFCRFIRLGFYTRALERFQQVFGRERMRVWLYEEFTHRPTAVVDEMCDYLCIDRMELPDVAIPRENEAGVPRSRLSAALLRARWGILRRPRQLYLLLPLRLRRYIRNTFLIKKTVVSPMPAEAWDFLANVYREDIQRLQGLLGLDLSHWFRNRTAPRAFPTDLQKSKPARPAIRQEVVG
jgi:hypothetical protein